MPKCITDMETWLLDNSDRILSYLVYRRMFTPYEQEQKYMDESEFADPHYEDAVIEEAVDLGNGDWLLGLRPVNTDDGRNEPWGFMHFYRLSELRIAVFDRNNEEESE